MTYNLLQLKDVLVIIRINIAYLIRYFKIKLVKLELPQQIYSDDPFTRMNIEKL